MYGADGTSTATAAGAQPDSIVPPAPAFGSEAPVAPTSGLAPAESTLSIPTVGRGDPGQTAELGSLIQPSPEATRPITELVRNTDQMLRTATDPQMREIIMRAFEDGVRQKLEVSKPEGPVSKPISSGDEAA